MRICREESGLGTLEYGLIICLVAMLAIAALLFLGTGSNSSLTRDTNRLPGGKPGIGAP